MGKFEDLKISLSFNPEKPQIFKSEGNVRIAILTKHNTVYFSIDEDDKIVNIISDFNVLHHPNKLKL